MGLFLFFFLQSFCSYNIKVESSFTTTNVAIQRIINKADSLMLTLDPMPKKGNILQFKDGYLLLFDGYSSVYYFENNQLNFFGNDNFHGYNFGRSLFIKGDTLMRYGGSGFWSFHPEISYFDFKSEIWIPFSPINKKPYYEGGTQEFAFLRNNQLVVFFAETFPFSLIRERIPLKKNKLHFFDFERKEWNSSNLLDIMTKVLFNYILETENFLIIYDSGFPVWLLEKKNLRLYELPKNLGKFGFFDRDFPDEYHLFVKGDSVSIIRPFPNFEFLQSYDFTQHFSEIQEEDFLVKENKIVNPLRLILFSVILIIFVPVVFISRKIIQMVSFPHPYFLFNTGTIYSKEELVSLINSDEIKDEYPIDGLLIVQKIKQSKDRRVNNYFLKPQGFTFLFKISLGIFKRYFYKEETIDA